MALLGFDYGRRRIGIALGHPLTGQARALTTVQPGRPSLWPSISALVSEWNPSAFVVGWPTQADGQPTVLAPALRAFAAELESRYQRPVYWANEYLTSHLGQERMQQQRKRRNPGLDAHAAALILEGWLLENPAHDRA